LKRFNISLDNLLKRLKLALLFSPLANAGGNVVGKRSRAPSSAYAVVRLFRLMNVVCWGSGVKGDVEIETT
jgi:hypothetical protein